MEEDKYLCLPPNPDWSFKESMSDMLRDVLDRELKRDGVHMNQHAFYRLPEHPELPILDLTPYETEQFPGPWPKEWIRSFPKLEHTLLIWADPDNNNRMTCSLLKGTVTLESQALTKDGASAQLAELARKYHERVLEEVSQINLSGTTTASDKK